MSQQIGTATTLLANYPNLADARLFLFGSDANVDDSILLSDLIQHIRAGFTGSGLTQAEVDARVNAILDAVIPAAKRIPDFAQGDAGQVVAVNQTGDGLVIVPASTTPGPAGPAGPTGPAGPSGATTELSVVSALPDVSGYTAGDIINLAGELQELVAAADDQNVYRSVIGDSTTNAGVVDSGYLGDAVFEYQPSGTAPENRRLYIPKTAPGFATTQPTQIYVALTTPAFGADAPHGLYANLQFTRSSGDDRGATDTAHPNTYAYHKTPGGAGVDAIPVGTQFKLEFYSDSALTTALAFHAANRWERDDRNEAQVSDYALANNDDRWPKNKLPTDVNYGPTVEQLTPGRALDTVNPSQHIVSTNANAFPTSGQLFNPMIDLDVDAHGEFHLSLELIYAPVGTGTENIGFEQKANQTDDDRTIERSNIIFASAIAAQDAIQATNIGVAPNGIEAFRIPLYSLNTTQGYYNLWLTRNSNNQIGYYWFWEAAAGSTGGTMTATLRATFTPADASVRNSRGRLLATSATLQTAQLANGNAAINSGWTLESNVGTLSSNGTDLVEPLMRLAKEQLGYWFVLEVNGVEISEAQFTHSLLSTGVENRLYCDTAKSQVLKVRQFNNGSWQVQSEGTTIPAASVIKVYMAVI